MEPAVEAAFRETMDPVFEALDTNQNGLIDKKELLKALKKGIGEGAKDYRAEFFEVMDTNEDGQISKEEFLNGCVTMAEEMNSTDEDHAPAFANALKI